jgi:hypothetical protein
MELYYNERTVRRPYARYVAFLGCAVICAHLDAQEKQAPARRNSASYEGVGACTAPACHGSVQPLSQNSVLQNEYTTWIVNDKHAQAFKVLRNDTSTRMLKILGIPWPEDAEAPAKCLACHAAAAAPSAKRAKTFDATDGVGCEACHGAASPWLGNHTTQGWDYNQSVQAGMCDTRDLIARSKICLSCHIGTAEKSVDHAMIAAGHPDLFFELDSFEAVMPRHWKKPDDPWIDIRTLAVGEAVQLRASLQRLRVRANGSNWPEYSELDCFACHHSLASKDSWRQSRWFE